MDWNNDAKKDLLTGEGDGKIRIYLNTGTDANPVFSGYSYVQQGGADFDAGNYSTPYVTDWNNDNKKDLICGDSSGQIWLLINTGTDPDPVFPTKVRIQDGGGNLKVSDTVSPCVVDWNRDAKKDLIVGAYNGRLHYFENQGTDDNPVFNGYILLQSINGGTIDVGAYSRPNVVDWDEDNVMDIICGDTEGYVEYFHAKGPLSLDVNWISASGGTRVAIDLNAGLAHAGRNYLIMGSVSGTEPGIPLPGGMVVLPINWDPFTNIALMLANTPPFDNFLGVLDANGMGEAKMDLGIVPGAAGLYISLAYALNKPWDYVSNAANIEVLP